MKAVLLCLCLLCPFLIAAQTTHKYSGYSGHATIASHSAVLTNGNRVVVGTVKNGPGADFDALVTCLSPGGTPLWTVHVATTKGDRFFEAVATADGGVVAVGQVNQDLTSAYNDGEAAVYKFDASGTELWHQIFNTTAYAEMFMSVVEVPGSGDIVCGGQYEYGLPSANTAFMVCLDRSGTVNWQKRYAMVNGNEIQGLAYLNGKIVAAGLYRWGATYYDGHLFAVKANDGSVVWNKGFDFYSNFSSSLNTNWPYHIQINGGRIYLDAYISAPWGGGGGSGLNSTPALLSFDTTGGSPFCLEFPITGMINVGNCRSKVVSDTEIYLVQHPAAIAWSYMHTEDMFTNIGDVVITRINSMSSPLAGMRYCRSFSISGSQGLLHTDIVGDTLIGFGAVSGDPARQIGPVDIYSIKTDKNLPMGPDACISDVAGIQFAHPPISLKDETFLSVTNITLLAASSPVVSGGTIKDTIACKTIPDPNKIEAGFSLLRTACLTVQFTDLSTTTTVGIKSWYWEFGDGTTSTLQHPSYTFPGFGTYSIKLVVTDSLGKRDSITKVWTVVQERFAQAGNDTLICSNDEVSVPLWASGGVSYSWTPASLVAQPNQALTTATISMSTVFVVTVTDTFGCSDTDSVFIRIVPAMQVTARPDTVQACAGDTVHLYAQGAEKYSWFPPVGLSKDNIANPVLTVSRSLDYIVTGSDQYGCTGKDTVHVVQHPSVKVEILRDNPVVDCYNDRVILTAKGAEHYSWSPAVYCDEPDQATTKVKPPHTLVFRVEGSNAYGCKSEDTITVFISNEVIIKVPNAFTPNGDQLNDKIRPLVFCGFTLTDFAIYNRWGEQVFISQDLATGWDGTFNGMPCSANTYYYLLRGKNSREEEVVLKGDISLIR